MTEKTLPNPDIGNDYSAFWRRLLNQSIQSDTVKLLNREGIATNQKEFNLDIAAPVQLEKLLRLRSERDDYYGSVADVMTITKGCRSVFRISLASETLSYELVSETKRNTPGSYKLIFQDGKSPKVDFKVKRGWGYKRIPGWIFRVHEAGDRDFEIIKDAVDLILAPNPSSALSEKELIEHKRQIHGDRYVDEYSQEAMDIEAQAKARIRLR